MTLPQPRDVGRNAAVNEREHQREKDIAYRIVEYEEVMEDVCGKEAEDERLFGHSEGVVLRTSIPCKKRAQHGIPERGGKQAEIEERAHDTACDEPIEDEVMRAVIPCFRTVKLRPVVFVEDIAEVLLSPAEQRTFLDAFERHAPDREANGT